MLSRINRHRISLALVFTLLLGTLMPIMAFGASAVQFKDTADSYAQQEIQALADAGILSGYEDNSFQPRKAMTRAELAKIIVLALGLKENPDKAASFQDVGANSWYRGYVGALVASGITQGTSATAFSPENKVTREELVVFFLRAFGLEETAKKLPADAKLADLSEVSDWAKPHVSLAFNMGFVNGIDSNGVLKFEPKASAERQALARLAYEFKVNKEKYIEKAKALEAAAATGGAATTPGTSGTGSTGTGTGSGATGGGGGGGSAVSSSDDDAQRFTVDSVQSLDPQTVQVTFTTSIRRVSDVRTFSFDGGLTVISADPKQGSNTVLITTSTQNIGQVYKLIYNDVDTGKTFTGKLPLLPILEPKKEYTGSYRVAQSGTNGPEGVFEEVYATINGNVYIESAGVTLQNTVINGDLVLGEEIGNGDAILNHVKVNGQTIIKGGGDHSVHLQDTVLLSVIIDKRSGAVRVVAEGATSVQQTTLQSSVILENSTGTDAGFNNVTVDQSMPANSYVSLRGDFNTVDVFAANIAISVPSGLINSLQVRSGADNASLDLGGSSRISNLLLNAVAAVTGTGGISNAWLNVSGISFEYLPDQYGLGAGVQEPSHGSSNATLLQYINVSNGAVQLNFNRPLADATLDDFAVTAKLNGQPYVLENLAYDAAQQKLTFKQLPADQYHMQELSIAVAPSETTTKFSRRSVLTTIKITGFEGTVWDVNNNPVSGMTIRFRDRAGGTVGPVLATVVTDANGRYKVTLPPGLYTGELVADGFIPGYVVGQASLNWYYTDENATAIRIPGENETRIVLVWGEVPRDLDSHLVGPTPDAASHFHTWYGGKIYSYNNVVFDDLDHDDVTAYGPETTTIRQNVYGTYRFYVHNYSGENSLRTSQAEVKVYRGNNPEPVESYQVPTGTGTERYWAVFDMNISESGITFTDINQLMTTADQADGSEVNVATVTSRVYSVNNSLNTIGGVAAGISTAAFKAGLSPSVTGVTYDVYAPGSSIAKTGPIISGDQLIVKAANGITKKLYTIVTSGMAVDTEAPQQVANLTASNVTATSLTLSWSPSTDNMPGSVRYAVYSGGTYLTTVTGTTYQVTGLTAGQSYSFTVKAFDTAGNYAPASNPFTVDTLVSLDAVTDSYALNRNVPETDHGQLAANEVESGGVGQAQEVSNSMLLFPSGAIEV